ncbi:MAG: patatin-like phospholipase family protein [Litoreibacter sp.]
MNSLAPRRSDGTIQQKRVQQPWPKDRLFKILSIDGGGIRGVFPAAYLAELEKRFLGGASIADHFDMVAGTSTGGIIALALAKGMTAKAALDIYLNKGDRIFPTLKGAERIVRSVTPYLGPEMRDVSFPVLKGCMANPSSTRHRTIRIMSMVSTRAW